MAKFVWQPLGQQAMAFAIRQERVSVGRDAGNDICLPESSVSSRHAVVTTRAGQSTVHDLNSSNGTWINGERIESQQLSHGDVVQFGRLTMNYVDEAQATSTRMPPKGSTVRAVPQGASSRPALLAPSANGAGPFKAPTPQAPPDGPDLGELDRLLGSIRGHRSSEEKEQEKKRDDMLEEWKKIVGYCGALKTRLASETRVRYFEISDRRNEIVIRVERGAGQPTRSLSLSLGHSERRDRFSDAIWMRQSGQPDKRYEKSADAMRDLVTTVAHMLA